MDLRGEHARPTQSPASSAASFAHPTWHAQAILCNPKITEFGGSAKDVEGCLSLPGFTADVVRPKWVKVEYQDKKGKLKKKRLTGFIARVFQACAHARAPTPFTCATRDDACVILTRGVCGHVAARVRPSCRHAVR